MGEPQRIPTQLEFLSPLVNFYRAAGIAVPAARQLTAEEVPQPYRRLLCHDEDMTPTLEAAWGEVIKLYVIASRVQDEVVSREVVLELSDRTPVEMGAIEIHLSSLPRKACDLIREGTKPLGAILRDEGVAHSSHPASYFAIEPDAAIAEALDASEAELLYGRQNVLRHASGEVLANVLEILPPMSPVAPPRQSRADSHVGRLNSGR